LGWAREAAPEDPPEPRSSELHTFQPLRARAPLPCPPIRAVPPLSHPLNPNPSRLHALHIRPHQNLLLLNIIFGANQRQQLRLQDALQREVRIRLRATYPGWE
jgi:hypothetical protein